MAWHQQLVQKQRLFSQVAGKGLWECFAIRADKMEWLPIISAMDLILVTLYLSYLLSKISPNYRKSSKLRAVIQIKSTTNIVLIGNNSVRVCTEVRLDRFGFYI